METAPLRGVHADDVQRIAARAFGRFARSCVAPDHQDERRTNELGRAGRPANLRVEIVDRRHPAADLVRRDLPSIADTTQRVGARVQDREASSHRPSPSRGTSRRRPRRADAARRGIARRSSMLPAGPRRPGGRSVRASAHRDPGGPATVSGSRRDPSASGSGRPATHRDRRIRSNTSASSPCGPSRPPEGVEASAHAPAGHAFALDPSEVEREAIDMRSG